MKVPEPNERAVATDWFEKGDRVRFSDEGLKVFPKMQQATGIVTGFGRTDQHVLYVRSNRQRTAQRWAYWFWDKVQP